MAEMYRAPKAVQEEAQKILSPVADAVRNNQLLTLEQVAEIRSTWASTEGRIWAKNICDKVATRASVVTTSEEDAMAINEATPDLSEQCVVFGEICTDYIPMCAVSAKVKGNNIGEKFS